MAFASRRRVLRYGYESTARLLIEDFPRWEAAFGKLGVRVDTARLQPPWEPTA